MRLISAWAWGERKTRPMSWPGANVSAPYFARPVTLSRPSGRGGRVPTDLNCRFLNFVSFAISGISCGLGRVLS